MPEFIETMLAVVAGGGITIISEYFRDLRARDRDAADAARVARHEARSTHLTMQRTALLSLQEASQRLGRALGALQMADLEASRAAQRWVRGMLDPDTNESAFRAVVDMVIQTSRIADAETRRLSDVLRTCQGRLTMAASEEQSFAVMADALDAMQGLHERIGGQLRGDIPIPIPAELTTEDA